ncbi:plastocyanin [Gloeobacter kilaueensis]|uniref:Plastocyanin n=1 Tax=Gloeobacter kilaueensis (strain ATCC BAA-2537 / CCAP 1431/1 / ULC 316 / JS1) TaxID=1183438 RepID=U5QM84_GLOK1|nr:plastocyanin [Gloeobacter kilaueensis]AGY58719.1 plastocyanin [Gloeobacter kilaueensis JS1]
MMSLSKLAASSLVALIAVSALGLAAQAKQIDVKMGADTGQLVFVPNKIDAAPGDTIKWTLNKAGPHNVVFDGAKSADPTAAKAISQTKLLSKPGDSYTSTIPASAKKGTYSFHCVPHLSAGMIGTLTVK